MSRKPDYVNDSGCIGMLTWGELPAKVREAVERLRPGGKGFEAGYIGETFVVEPHGVLYRITADHGEVDFEISVTQVLYEEKHYDVPRRTFRDEPAP